MKNLITALLTLWGTLIFAQNTTDVLYLKNGSILKGKIIEETSAKTKIETNDGNIFAFSADEIEKKELLDKPLPGNFKTKGYYNYTSMGILAGSSKDDKQSVFSMLMEHNYQVNNYFAVGAVTGIEFFNEAIAPVGGNMKVLLPLQGKSMLFTNLSVGYSISLEDAKSDNYYEYTETKGGVFANGELGLIFPSKSYTNLFVALGYRYNELNYERFDWYYDEVKRKVSYNRFSIKLGVVLH